MRRLAAAALALLLGAGGARPLLGQIVVADGAGRPDTLAASYRLDFAIPDAPAFELLSVDAGSVLRPATVRALALALSGFGSLEKGVQLPRSFAAEVAPFLLARGRTLTLAQYRATPALYRFRVSGATGRDTLQRARAALGVRLALQDRADIRTSDAYLRRLTDVATRVNAVYAAARRRIGPPPAPIVLNADELAQLAGIEEEVGRLRRAWADSTWNADAFELAAAAGATAEDSLGNGLTLDALSGWATLARGFGSWGQLLLGARGGARRDSLPASLRGFGGASARLYLGVNRYKAFAEAGATASSAGAPAWLLNGGGDARFLDSFWTTFSAGLEWGGPAAANRPRLRSRLALKLGLPRLAEP